MEAGTTLYLKLFTIVTYFAGMCPFRLSLSRDMSGKFWYVGKSWLPQMILCWFQVFAGLLYELRTFYKYIPGQNDFRNPVKYFLFASRILDATLNVITVRKLFLDKNEFIDVANSLLSKQYIVVKKSILTHPVFAGAIAALYTGVGLVNWIFASKVFTVSHSTEGEKMTSWTLQGWWNKMVEIGWEMIFVKDTRQQGGTNEEILDIRIFSLEFCVGILGIIGYFQR